ncbi:MAG: DNA primase [Oscillospiraceae bacterium]|nr:DNA primase [Oscillospiraceae bacterium]
MTIPGSFLDDLVSRVDITDVVGSYVRLTKRSGSSMLGLCPFHSEKTPSFSVNADKQIYHCFGCGKGGGVINFIMEIENLQFRDAVEILAKRAGVTVPDSGVSDELMGKRQRMLTLNRDAAKHFHEMLSSPLGQTARDYLAMRGMSKAFITKFGIGAAPDSWSLLMDAMIRKGYSRQELLEAGLARSSRKEGGAYDLFRNRLMFPVIDVRGHVIGFSGRILGDGEPKYLNSPDTLVFSKSRNLFALNLAKKTKAGMLILVEGNIDVVALHQAGFDSAVASLGTALTAEQARLMARYTEMSVIAFDSDEAGKRAALRAIPLLEKTGMAVKLVDMGVSKDPDEFLKKQGADAFKILLQRSENHISYKLMSVRNNYDLSTDEGRIGYISAATAVLSELESKPEREVYGGRVAKETGVSPESIQMEIAKKFKSRKTRARKDFEKKVTRPREAFQQTDRQQREANVVSAVAEEGVIRCLARDPMLISIAQDMGFSHTEFTSTFLAETYEKLTKRILESRDTRASLLLSEFDAAGAARLTNILEKPEALPYSEQSIREYISKIRSEKFRSVVPDSHMLLEIKKFREQNGLS